MQIYVNTSPDESDSKLILRLICFNKRTLDHLVQIIVRLSCVLVYAKSTTHHFRKTEIFIFDWMKHEASVAIPE